MGRLTRAVPERSSSTNVIWNRGRSEAPSCFSDLGYLHQMLTHEHYYSNHGNGCRRTTLLYSVSLSLVTMSINVLYACLPLYGDTVLCAVSIGWQRDLVTSADDLFQRWLPIKFSIKSKIHVIRFGAFQGRTPAFVKQLLQQHGPNRNLRSSDQGLLVSPCSRLKTKGGCAFEVVAPKLWESLPLDLWCVETVDTFKKQLKTHLVRLALVSFALDFLFWGWS